MKRIETRGIGIARLIAITVLLLLAPFSASAVSSISSESASSSYGGWAAHHVNIAPDTLEHHSSSAEEPLHCHMRSPNQQEIGPAQAAIKDDLPVPALHEIFAPARDAGTQLPAILARIPIPAPPRFTLFGNFRS